MCTGAMILFGIKRCVMGENDTFTGASIDLLVRKRANIVLQAARGSSRTMVRCIVPPCDSHRFADASILQVSKL